MSRSIRPFLLLISAVALLMGGGCGDDDEERMQVVDLAGHVVNPLTQAAGDVALLLFVRSDCPISNRYAPEIRCLHEVLADRGVRLFLVYVDPDEPVENIRRHLREFDLPGVPLRDLQHSLVKLAGATITSEAVVFNRSGEQVYLGRIDDRYVDFGKTRPEPTRRDLEEALTAVLEGTIGPLHTTKAVGCFIADLKPAESD